MAEGRMLKRKITKSKKMAALKGDKPRLLWFYMLPFTDVEGRIEADPEDIRDEIIRKQRRGFTLARIEDCLQDLHRVGLIVLYTVNGRRYLEFTRHSDEQSLRPDKEAKSKIPSPNTGEVQAIDGTTPAISKDKLSKEKRREVKDKPPTLEEIKSYIKEKGYSVDATKFLEWYTESGWKDRDGRPVRNWKLKVISWSNRNDRGQNNNPQRGTNRRNSFAKQESAIGTTVE